MKKIVSRVFVCLVLCLTYITTMTSKVVANQTSIPVGVLVEDMYNGIWYPASVKEVGPDRIRTLGAGVAVNTGTGGKKGGQPPQEGFRAGSMVEVLSGGRWYPAKVKEVRANGRWFISYDGWSSYWDEEVGADRIRAKGSTAASAPPGKPVSKVEETFAWPARSSRGSTPIEGVYLQLVVYTYPYTSYNYVSWFFTRNGRFSESPAGGVSLTELSSKPRAKKGEGTYWVEGNQLVMAKAGSGEPERRSGYKGIQLLPIGAGATRQSAFTRGWRLDGSYEGGASIGGGALSSSNELNFRRDGTYTRGSVTSVSSSGRNTEVSGGVTGSGTGTYHFDEYTLTLRENGTERKYTVFAYGSKDAAGRPEQIFWEGGLIKRLDK